VTTSFQHVYNIELSNLKLPEPWVRAEEVRVLGAGSFSSPRLIRLIDKNGSPALFALKVLAPLINAVETEAAIKDFKSEVNSLVAIRDLPSVPRVLFSGSMPISCYAVAVNESPYYVYEYEPNFCTVASVAQALESSTGDGLRAKVGVKFAIDVIHRLTQTIRDIHGKSIRHFDIHPSNVLVRASISNGEARCDGLILIDFGKSSGKRSEEMLAPILKHFMSRPLLEAVLDAKGKIPMHFASSEEGERSNFYAAGRTCESLLDKTATADTKSPLIAAGRGAIAALLSPDLAPREIAATATAICERVFNRRTSSRAVAIRTFQGGNSVFDALQMRLIDTPALQRLRNVLQLGPTHLLYPGATHTRFVHTLGVAHLAQRYVDAAVQNDPHFLNDDSERIAAPLYALLHDVGHYPFAHYLEELVKDLPPKLADVVNHETLGERIWRKGDAVACPRLTEELERFQPGFGPDWLELRLGAKKRRNHIGRIVDGPMDCDKLDYLVRDAVACGVAYPLSIDVERLIGSVTRNSVGRNYTDLAITAKGVASVEALLLARTQMYSEVYLHKSCRGMAACVKKAFWLLVQPNIVRGQDWISPDELAKTALGTNDSDFLKWIRDGLRACGGSYESAARLLIDDVFLSGERKLFKRVRTLSVAFPKHKERNLSDLRERIDRLDFAHRDKVERSFEALLTKKLRKSITPIPAYSILLDAVHTTSADLPEVVRGAGLPPESLIDVSPTVRALSGNDQQPRHNKVRLFATPAVAAEIRDALSDTAIDDLLFDALGS
jgi:uncharacterized protein